MSDRGIFDAKLAALLKSRRGQKYCPSNGTEGFYFMAAYCDDCSKQQDQCEIVAKTFVYDAKDDEYPVEWQYGEDGQPKCTAFVERKDGKR